MEPDHCPHGVGKMSPSAPCKRCLEERHLAWLKTASPAIAYLLGRVQSLEDGLSKVIEITHPLE